MNVERGSAWPDETTGSVTGINGGNVFTLNAKDENLGCDARPMQRTTS